MSLYIGLDISTTTIGYSAIIINNKKIEKVTYGYYKPTKKKSEKDDKVKYLFNVRNDILNILDKIDHKEDTVHICVEDFLLFMKNRSTATTITTLASINRVLCVALFEKYNKVNLLPVMTIRAQLKRLAELKDKINKEDIPTIIEKVIRNNNIEDWAFNWKTNKKGKIMVENYDMADGIAVALAYAYKNKEL